MKKLQVAIIARWSLSSYSAVAQPDNQNPPRKLIKAVINNYEQAWNRHDAKALAEQYHTDATWVN